MLISYQWLKDFVNVSDTPNELADCITMAGLEVDSVIRLNKGLENVVVGQIVSKDPVPNSDHLTLCQVDVGQDVLQIVCGAPNHQQGDKVLVALPGAVLPGGIEIRQTKVRSVESFGMICSEKELAISDQSSGVVILPEETTVGGPASNVLGRNDTILEIDLTPNRSDALSHLGVAREISALKEEALKIPEIRIVESQQQVESLASVEINDPELCLRYLGRVITGVKVGPSPRWIQQRLQSVGLRPINNIVDITNYVLMEWGHPLHAFDCDLLTGKKIVVRRAVNGERIRTLDGVNRKLDPSVLVICDAEKPVAIAGVMGGENTEVNEKTVNIFLEAACFQPTSIRKTSKKLSLHSESSHRFERGTDIEGMVNALNRAAALMQEMAGGHVAKGMIDLYPGKTEPTEIKLSPERVCTVLGIKLSKDEIAGILKRLSLTITEAGDQLIAKVPSFRVDLCREIDLIEEVARIYGYNHIPSDLPKAPMSASKITKEQRIVLKARDVLAGLGYFETIHYSFHNPRDLSDLMIPEDDPLRSQIRIRNPLSEDQSVLRTTLISGLLHTLQRNLKRSIKDIRIFETGRIFEKKKSGLPAEINRLAGVITGKKRPQNWDTPPQDTDFFDLKGDLEILFKSLGLTDIQYRAFDLPHYLHPGKSAWIECKGSRLGTMGEMHPAVMKKYEIPSIAVCFELDLDLCTTLASELVKYKTVPRYPWVERDIALILSEEITSSEINRTIQNVEPDLIREIRIFDLYRGKPIPSGKKSLAFSIRFQANDRTLTDDEVNLIRDRIVDELNNKFQATLRDV